MSRHKLFDFRPSFGRKMAAIGGSDHYDHYLEYWSTNPLHTWCIHWWAESSEMIPCTATLAKSRPSVCRKMVENGHVQPLSGILIAQSTLTGSSEMIRFWATLVKFQPSGGPKMAEISGSRPLSGILITQSTSCVPYKLFWWVFKNDLIFGHAGQISALWWPKNFRYWWFRTIMWSTDHSVPFIYGVYFG